MAPARTESPVPWSTAIERVDSRYEGPLRNIETIDAVEFAANLQPTEYTIFGTHEKSKILFLDVQILDSTGADPYKGDVLIEGQHSPCLFESFHHPRLLTFHQAKSSQQLEQYQTSNNSAKTLPFA
jgi:hypothetical protein